MKKILFVSLSLVLCIALVASMAIAKNGPRATKEVRDMSKARAYNVPTGNVSDVSFEPLHAAAVAGTTELCNYTFDAGGCSVQGWVSADITSQLDYYWHVDDYAGLGGGDYGLLQPVRGTQSLWCGHPSDTAFAYCGYLNLPGYGNGWDQMWCTKACLAVAGPVTVDFIGNWDTEAGWDQWAIEIDDAPFEGTCTDLAWTRVGGLYDGFVVDSTVSHTIPVTAYTDQDTTDAGHSGSIGIRFRFASDGAWSDQDGLWNTDGAIHLDSLSVSDSLGLKLAVEDFESGEADGAQASNDWEECTPVPYGDYAGLYTGVSLPLEDPCLINFSCMWEFFDSQAYWGGLVSTDFHCTIGGQLAVPLKNSRNQYIWNEVWSPDIPFVGAGATTELQFDVYRELPRVNRMYYIWHIRSVVAGCPGLWKDQNYVYYGDQKDWLSATYDASSYISGAATHLNIAVGAIDMCPYWCSPATPGSCHTHSPLIDNVILRRINNVGPQWTPRDLDFWNDTFEGKNFIGPGEPAYPAGKAPADIANDIAVLGQPHIDPGDSATIAVNDPILGLDAEPTVYVAVWPQGQAGKSGPEIASYDQTGYDFDTLGVPAYTADRWPLIDSLVDGSGTTWYCFRMDSAFTDGYTRTGWQPDRFCIDLNDYVFEAGDTICYYFKAVSTGGAATTLYTRATGAVDGSQEALVQANPAEFTILPAGGVAAGGDILYVDGMDGRGAQPYFDSAFQSMGILHQVDRYDINNPSSGLANRPGARVFDIQTQVVDVYRKIIWNTGNLSAGCLGDGDTSQGANDKSDDALLLHTFLSDLASTGGVYFSGDDLAEYIPTLINTAPALKNDFFPYNLTSSNYFDYSGGTTAPLSVGVSGGIFDHVGGADSHVAYGGCLGINDFDVIEPTGDSNSEMTFQGSASALESSVISNTTNNDAGFDVGVVLQTYSYHYIRDDDVDGLADRYHHLDDILAYLGNPGYVATGASKPAGKYALSQNYPNPFNPTTTIDYSLKTTGHVSLNIYNVAGQLVRTLVDDTKSAGSFKIEWNGRDNAGQAVSSGVYFYKLVSGDFSMTKKMVLLK